jgi:hypothetical protein
LIRSLVRKVGPRRRVDVHALLYYRRVENEDVAFVGGKPDDPAFSALLDAMSAPVGMPIESYARPLSSEQQDDYLERLDAVEPAHANAAALLPTLFAG